MNSMTRKPPKSVVERHAESAAAEAGALLEDVLGMTNARLPYRARRKAWCAIMAETGCSLRGLAIVWGCDHKAIHRAVRVPA